MRERSNQCSVLTLISRNILVTLRLIKEHRTRLVIQAKVNFKAAIIRGGGSPKAWKHKTAVH